MAYFELSSARDVFGKAERELARLKANFDIDHVFNFFVTAYHIQDYARKDASIPQAALTGFLADTDIQVCRDLCDKGKHLQLTRRPDPKTRINTGSLNGAPINTISLNGGEKWVVLTGNREVEIVWLAERVIAKWRDFLDHHGV